MTDVIFCSPDFETILEEAKRLGFTRTDLDGKVHILTEGSFPAGGGWSLNIVGNIPSDEGFWGRLRISNEAMLPDFSPNIVQYKQFRVDGPDNYVKIGWTKDGETFAPSWVGEIGLIA